LASSADERGWATGGAGDASPASSVVKVWRAGGPRRLRDRRDGDDVIDALAPCFATHDAHGGAHVTCLAFLDGTGGGVPLAASADDAGAVHVWRADTGALLSRVREPNAAGPIGAAPRFAGSREAASRGWEARARAIERRKRIAAAILEQTRDDDDDDDDDDEDDEDDEDDDASRVFSDDGDDDAFASSRDALSPSFPSRHGNRDPGRTAPRRETSASSDMLLDELSGPELGDLIGDDVLGDGPRRRRRAADASAFFASVSRPSPTPSPRAAGLFGYGASDSNDSERFFSEPSSSTGYACLASTNDPNHLVLGTNDGRVRFVDVANERVAGSWLCDASRGGGAGGVFSSVENERKDNHDGASINAITSVCFFGAGVTDGAQSSANALACAGTRNGAVSFLDRRGGRLVAGFRAHDDAVVAIKARGVPPDGSHSSSSATALSSPYLVTASRDKTVCVWDARMLTGASFLGNRAIDTQKRKNPLVSKFVGFGDGVCAMATFGADAFVVAGEKLSVFSLDDRPPNDAGVVTHTVPGHTVLPVAPLRLRARNGAKVRSRLTGVAILPRSRLFAVTGEDGKVRVCR
jgi:WD40 repeat protein